MGRREGLVGAEKRAPNFWGRQASWGIKIFEIFDGLLKTFHSPQPNLFSFFFLSVGSSILSALEYNK